MFCSSFDFYSARYDPKLLPKISWELAARPRWSLAETATCLALS